MNVEIEWKHNCHFSYWYSSNGQKSAIFIRHPGPYTNLNMTVENNDNDYYSSCCLLQSERSEYNNNNCAYRLHVKEPVTLYTIRCVLFSWTVQSEQVWKELYSIHSSVHVAVLCIAVECKVKNILDCCEKISCLKKIKILNEFWIWWEFDSLPLLLLPPISSSCSAKEYP